MRKIGEWMAKYDDRILEYIRENRTGQPADISRNKFIHCSASYIGQRLKQLEERGLVKEADGAAYRITKKGRAYLVGAYDAEREEYLHKVEPERGVRNYEWVRLHMEDLVDDADRLLNEFKQD